MLLRIRNLILLVFTISLFACSNTKFRETLFNDHWEFKISDLPVEQILNEGDWESITLPHTPHLEPRVMDGQWQGICWYKKEFALPLSSKNKRLFLRFEGAMNVSEFWMNGIKAASHKGGYLPVVFEFSDMAKFGSKNTILVRLDNNDNQVTGPKPMRNLDFNMYGGLYRDVSLMVKDPLHITDPILAKKPGGGGVFVRYLKVEKEEAILEVLTQVINQDGRTRTFIVVNELWKDSVLVAGSSSQSYVLRPGDETSDSSLLSLVHPELWSPQSPTLYTLKTIIFENDKVRDYEETRTGIRKIDITKESFRINGEEQFLRGINRHQEYPYVGYALSNEAQYRDALRIKEAGFDYIRLSHYPHAPAFMDACDELGLLVTDAILGWQYFSREPEFQEQVFNTCRDLIRRDRNHPCVMAWEVSLNESWMDSSFIDQLTGIAHEEYPGGQCYTAGWQEYKYDIYLQARQHRLQHYQEPEKPYSVSEYGDWEYYAMNAGFNQDKWSGLLQAERSSRQLLSDGEIRLLQQASNIQEAHNDNFNTPAFSDSYWVMFDYNRGYSNDLEASGIMSIDRVPKFSYYFFQSQRNANEISEEFSSGPMVKIASWWTRESPLKVRVFSNSEEVELLVNGISAGKQAPDMNSNSNNLSHPPFSFKIDKFVPGVLVANAFINNKKVASDTVCTPGIISKLKLTTELEEYRPEAGKNDLIFVYASLVDENGTVVRENDRPVSFYVKGDAKLIGPAIINTEAGISSALIRTGLGKDSIYISAFSGEIQSNKVIFHPGAGSQKSPPYYWKAIQYGE